MELWDLDVYKRQVCSVRSENWRSDGLRRCQWSKKQFAGRTSIFIREGSKAVSYTHLDVYKRQE